MKYVSPFLFIAIFCFLTSSFPIPAAIGQNVFSSGSSGEDGELLFYSPPAPRERGDMVYDTPNNRILLFGGRFSSTFYNSLLEWDQVKWTEIETETLPPARFDHAMAYDSNRNVLVLFGGRSSNNVILGDTWEFDGTDWTQIVPELSPSAREQHAMVYDTENQQVVLFGGTDGQNENDTWVWDGTNWTQLSPANSPSARRLLSLAYDQARQVIVLFGGFSTNNETWEYQNDTWTRIFPENSPSPRYLHKMVYDTANQEVLMFGGISGDNQLWSWDGFDWTAKSVSQKPSLRNAHGFAYNSQENEAVLFGGNRGSIDNTTWVWDGGDWEKPNQTQPDPLLDMAEKPSGIWNYSTITIPSGVALSFKKNESNSPVIWLATGEVRINGSVSVKGSDATTDINPGNEAPGGPGGFAGGLGGRRQDVSGSFAGTPGRGPGGGAPGAEDNQNGGNGGYGSPGSGDRGGSAYGNRLINPLIGGSGGGGGSSRVTSNGGNGGGGGGAILIASSDKILIKGTINADRGNRSSQGTIGGFGSGGAIRLVANRIEGGGNLVARPNGRIRTEAFFVNVSGTIDPLNTAAPPISVDLQDLGTITITSIAGQVVPLNPTGNTNSPDVIFTEAGPITVEVTTQTIPEGTVLMARITSAGEIILVETTPVDQNGEATATVTVPAGIGTIQVFGEYEAP